MLTDYEALQRIRQLQLEYEHTLHAYAGENVGVPGDGLKARINYAAWAAWKQTMDVLRETQPCP